MYCIMQFLRKLWPIRLSSFLFMFCRIFLSFFSLSNNSSFLTRSVQLIFFILLQHHISGLPSYFWFIFRSVQFQCHTTVAYDGACSPNVSIRMAWISVSALLCRGWGGKTWWQLASRCCRNGARRLTCFLSASVTRTDLQFGTWTDPFFQRHFRFSPTTLRSMSG